MTEQDLRLKIKGEELNVPGISDHTALSWLFCLELVMADLREYRVDPDEQTILRSLACRVAELAELPIQAERQKLWTDNLSLKETRPLIFIDPELAWYEILPHTVLQCRNGLARVWEYRLRKEIFWQERIGDDRVCRREFSYQDIVHISDFGVPKRKEGGGNGKAFHIIPVIEDYDTDMAKLRFRTFDYDRAASALVAQLAHDTFDGILEVKRDNAWWYSCGLTSDLIELRGFDNFLYDIYDYPDELKAFMSFLRDDWLNMLDFLEKNDLLTLNNGGEFMGTGGYGWCDELPAPGFDPAHVRPEDLWGYGESQETVSCSPDAFAEFVLPYQVPILERFGLTTYGCCEPLDTRIDLIKAQVPHLRKVSVSPWSDVRLMAEKLGPDYVYCWKQNPAIIAGEKIDEDAIRADIRNTFAITREHRCPTQLLMRDVLTLAWQPENARRWTEIALEEARRCMD